MSSINARHPARAPNKKRAIPNWVEKRGGSGGVAPPARTETAPHAFEVQRLRKQKTSEPTYTGEFASKMRREYSPNGLPAHVWSQKLIICESNLLIEFVQNLKVPLARAISSGLASSLVALKSQSPFGSSGLERKAKRLWIAPT